MARNTIVCTTKNHFEMTRMCLESLTASIDMAMHEIILVDDNSTDATWSLAENFQIIRNRKGGLYRSWNIGIEASESEFVTVINNDLLFPQRDWWFWVEKSLRETIFEFVYPVDLESLRLSPKIYHLVGRAAKENDLVVHSGFGDIRACCFSGRRDLFKNISSFDERFQVWYGEKDFEIQLIRAGIPYGKVINSFVQHLGSATLTDKGRGAYEAAKRSDYQAFLDKFSSAELSDIGLTLPAFGPHRLLDGASPNCLEGVPTRWLTDHDYDYR